LILFLIAPARADEPRGAIEGVVIDATTRAPLAGATVIVTASYSYAVIAGRTNAAGRFRAGDLPRGSYQVLFVLGGAKDLHADVPVSPGVTTRLDGALAVAADETTVYEHLPTTPPEPIRSTVKKIPPYSDEAMDTNAWEVGWMLLDIDAAGQVASFRFLHRPGHALDTIAAEQVWKLRFSPARDAAGRPVASQRLWKMEWPSYWWQQFRLVSFAPVYSRTGFLVGSARSTDLVPCVGHAPLNLDRGSVYRDCSQPDLDKVFTESPIVRPAGI
jgi:hypothetical protein